MKVLFHKISAVRLEPFQKFLECLPNSNPKFIFMKLKLETRKILK